MQRLQELNLISGLARFGDRPAIERVLALRTGAPAADFRAAAAQLGDPDEIEALVASLELDPRRPRAPAPAPATAPATTHAHAPAPAPATTPAPPRGRAKMTPKDSLAPGQDHQARIVSLKKFGAFATLQNVFPKTDGLIHVSQMGTVALGDTVQVKILAIEGSRISLSMRDSGQPREPRRHRLTSPERFEIRQLIAAGVYSAKDYPDLDAPDFEADIEVEVRSGLPRFLEGAGAPAADAPAVAPADAHTHAPAPAPTHLARAIQQSKPKPASSFRPPPRAAAPPAPEASAPPTLPVQAYKSQLLEAVAKNQIIIVQGDTGSGKTTQIAQYLYHDGYASIACTQPRRVAAVSIATRVAEEMGSRPGDLVGYSIRFENCTSAKTRIKYMTDGILQQEIVSDPTLLGYSVVILDEAHERTLATDVLFALLKRACRARPDLKIIVTSATLDSPKFSQYFDNCPVYKIPGRTFPVEIQYAQQPELDYLEAAMFTAMQIHMSQPDGDILVFLTGQDEIDSCCTIMAQRAKDLEAIMAQKLEILPVYSALPSDLQARIFAPTPHGYRKLVFATNIAETSITIQGIRYVVDTGVVKTNIFDPQAAMDILKIVPVSRAQANQRAGRAGRTQPGKCYRLYTKESYDTEMSESTIPEIQRQDLSSTLLMLKAMGIEPREFDFMDKPPITALIGALQELYQLSALDANGQLTSTGRVIAKFPMSPSMAQVLLQSVRKTCAHEVLTIMAMLNINSVFIRPTDAKKLEEIERRRRKFRDPSGDHITLLNLYEAWAQSGYSSVWCSEYLVHERSMRRAQHIREQLKSILSQLKLRVVSCQHDRSLILKVFCSGYFRNVARLGGSGYRTLARDAEVSIHPQSVLFSKRAKYVLYNSLVMTSREYMSCVSEIQPAWLLEYAATFYTASETKEKIAPLLKKHENSDEWRISQQHKYVKYESTRF